MGYRSDVVIGITKPVYAHAQLFNLLPEMLKTVAVAHNDENAVYWEFENIKWYESYTEIETVDLYLETLENNPAVEKLLKGASIKFPYGFLRSGEDPSDVETRGDPYEFGIHVYCSIHYPGV